MKKESRRVRMTKKMLRDALLELLEEKPFGKITIKEICDKADVNRTTFYVYYETSEDLLRAVENDVLEQIPVSNKLQITDSDLEFLNLLTTFFEYVKENKRLFSVLILKADNTSFNERLIQTVMDKYQKQAILKDTPLARYEYIFCINGVVGCLKKWIEADFPFTSQKFAEMVLKMSVHATSVDGMTL